MDEHLHPTHLVSLVVHAVVAVHFRPGGDRHVRDGDLPLDAIEPRWSDADDLEALRAEPKLLSDYVAASAEAGLPEAVAEDDDPRRAPGRIFAAHEIPTDDWLRVEEAEVRGRYRTDDEVLRLSAFPDRHVREPETGGPVE